MAQGRGLVSYSIKKDLAAWKSLWGAASMDQSIMDIWVQKVTGSASMRDSVFNKAQYVTSNFHSNDVQHWVNNDNFL